MKKAVLVCLLLFAPILHAKEYIIKQVSDPTGRKPYYFLPNQLTIQPGDTVIFRNAQNDMHDVMFFQVPKGVNDIIASPMLKKKNEEYRYTFNIAGTYQFHCHPHEALGMKGTLIVGSPSKQDEIKRVSHHDLTRHTSKIPTE